MRVEPVPKAPTAVMPIMMPPPAPMPMMPMPMPMPMPIYMPMPKPVHHYPKAYGLYCCPVPHKPVHPAYHHYPTQLHGYHEHPGCCMHGKHLGGHDDWLLRRK